MWAMTRGIMCHPVPIAYELQACVGAGAGCLILDVGRRDAWGRYPIATRVVPVHARTGRS